MVKVFTQCSERSILKIEELLEGENLHGKKTVELDLEAEFSSLALDIIGLGVFNYDFGSVTKESPVIKVGENIIITMHFQPAIFYIFVCCASVDLVTKKLVLR